MKTSTKYVLMELKKEVTLEVNQTGKTTDDGYPIKEVQEVPVDNCAGYLAVYDTKEEAAMHNLKNHYSIIPITVTEYDYPVDPLKKAEYENKR